MAKRVVRVKRTELPDGYISQRQYAEEKGVDHKSVAFAIKTNKIHKGTGYVQHTDGRWYIVRDVADKEWANNYQATGNGNPNLLITLDTSAKQKQDNDSLDKAIAVKKIFDAKSAQLEYETKAGLLINKAEAERQLFEMGKRIRESILRVPDREIDTILAAGTRNQARELLYDALEAALLELSDIERQKVL